MKKKIYVAPSILGGDFGKLASEAKRAESAGADWLHVDIMDGHFVPNLTIGPKAVAAMRKAVKIPLDVHLMLQYPQEYIRQFADAGADIITVHVESSHRIRNTLKLIKDKGCRGGLVINPETPVTRLKPYLREVSLVLLMSVHPGFGNQKFIPEVLEKLRKLRKLKKTLDIEIDGGINKSNAKEVISAGANILAAGSAVFKKQNIKKAIEGLRNPC